MTTTDITFSSLEKIAEWLERSARRSDEAAAKEERPLDKAFLGGQAWGLAAAAEVLRKSKLENRE